MTLESMTYYLLFLILGLPIGVWCAVAWLCKDRGGVLGNLPPKSKGWRE